MRVNNLVFLWNDPRVFPKKVLVLPLKAHEAEALAALRKDATEAIKLLLWKSLILAQSER